VEAVEAVEAVEVVAVETAAEEEFLAPSHPSHQRNKATETQN
jgi:hypothetical protein